MLEEAGISPTVETVPEFSIPTPPDLPTQSEKPENAAPVPPKMAAAEPATPIASEDSLPDRALDAAVRKANAGETTTKEPLPGQSVEEKLTVEEDLSPPLLDLAPPSPVSMQKDSTKEVSSSVLSVDPGVDSERPASPGKSESVTAEQAAQLVREELESLSHENSVVASVTEPAAIAPEAPAPAAQLSIPADAESLGEIIRRCRASYEAIDGGYSAELVQEELGPEKTFGKRTLLIQAHIPSGRILLQWLDTVKQGRKISFDAANDASKLRIHLGPREPRLLGTRLTVDQNHFLIRASTRYPISKLGIQNWIRMLEKIHEANEKGDDSLGTLRLAGSAELLNSRKYYKIEQAADSKSGLSLLPPGGRRDWYIDAEQMLPTLIVIVGPDGETLERHELTKLQFHPELTEETLILE